MKQLVFDKVRTYFKVATIFLGLILAVSQHNQAIASAGNSCSMNSITCPTVNIKSILSDPAVTITEKACFAKVSELRILCKISGPVIASYSVSGRVKARSVITLPAIAPRLTKFSTVKIAQSVTTTDGTRFNLDGKFVVTPTGKISGYAMKKMIDSAELASSATVYLKVKTTKPPKVGPFLYKSIYGIKGLPGCGVSATSDPSIYWVGCSPPNEWYSLRSDPPPTAFSECSIETSVGSYSGQEFCFNLNLGNAFLNGTLLEVQLFSNYNGDRPVGTKANISFVSGATAVGASYTITDNYKGDGLGRTKSCLTGYKIVSASVVSDTGTGSCVPSILGATVNYDGCVSTSTTGNFTMSAVCAKVTDTQVLTAQATPGVKTTMTFNYPVVAAYQQASGKFYPPNISGNTSEFWFGQFLGVAAKVVDAKRFFQHANARSVLVCPGNYFALSAFETTLLANKQCLPEISGNTIVFGSCIDTFNYPGDSYSMAAVCGSLDGSKTTVSPTVSLALPLFPQVP